MMDTYEDKARSEATFRYTVENLSNMKDSQLSPPSYAYNYPWQIMVTSRISRTQQRLKQKYLSVFLKCTEKSESDSWSCYAIAELRLLSDKEGQDPFSRKFQRSFCRKTNSWGYVNFITWQDLLNVENGYIKDDSITFEVHIVADNYEARINRILEETKQDISGLELSIEQLKQEIVGKIEMLKGDTDEREERRKAASTSLSEESKQDISRVESNIRQWKQELVEKIEMLRAEMSKETENREFRETIIRRDEKEENKKRQKQLEVNECKKMEDRIKNVQKAVMKKNMIITGLGILILFMVLESYILPGCWHIYPRIA